ncbi:hypothetical protein FRC14_001421 [Serendipita sp. 396]|nr:hypothetical protein FRC14_001421 [Serendipita sp. 396]KAG8804064.1 hypothetical protein FRC16_000933 [Serendipita sp. 398]
MDTYGVEYGSSNATHNPGTDQATVNMSDAGHPPRYDALDKINQVQNAQTNFSHSKDATVESTLKSHNSRGNPSSAIATNGSSGRPSLQTGFNASSGFSRSQQNLASAASPSPIEAPIPQSASTPAIAVVPSSPLAGSTNGRPLGVMDSLATISEAPADDVSNLAERRANRRRSALDPTNHRLSGFLTNLLHLRERESPSSSNVHSSRPSHISRPPSPLSRSSVAVQSRNQIEVLPPAMPAPNLSELGLSLTVLTGDLPPHQFTAPTSGTFMSPHYLLLCHPQGLDVLPLVSPPQIQPYALIRRVPFKSVVVMEERGVLVAIAGRRDGVRVYVLEEVRKAVEWRIEVELRREMERNRREEIKKAPIFPIATPADQEKQKFKRKSASIDSLTVPKKPPPSSYPPSRSLSRKRAKSNLAPPPPPPVPMLPPSFPPPRLIPRTSVANFHIHRQASSRATAMSIAEAMGPQVRESTVDDRSDGKGEWMDVRHSDDEVLIAAGPSGSAALDERTSAISAAAAAAAAAGAAGTPLAGASTLRASQRRRPSNLDLSRVNEHGQRPPISSPAPTLMTIRQALNQAPRTAETAVSDPDIDNEPNGDVISFAEALLESRLPNAPPIGQPSTQPSRAAVVTRFPLSRQHPSSHGFGGQGLSNVQQQSLYQSHGRTTVAETTEGAISDQDGETDAEAPPRAPSRSGGSLRATDRRHRWSVLDGVFRPSGASRDPDATPAEPDGGIPLTRTLSDAGFRQSRGDASRDASDDHGRRGSRISNFSKLFRSKRREGSLSNPASNLELRNTSLPSLGSEPKSAVSSLSPLPPQAPPPKLEYIKLPGTKGSVMIKAVETHKKSFLAILCGDNGEKVELFAGTYRTALTLSRTFILPDSPKTLELQLQGDDLVEVFLVFAQNVFGLEPATVRVREVRIGRAELRAARRRANREANRQPTEDNLPTAEEEVAITSVVPPSDQGHEDTNIFANMQTRSEGGHLPLEGTRTPLNASSAPPSASISAFPRDSTATPPLGPPATPHPDELATAALMGMGPYTTFQQLFFAPPFPLASLAEECIIPPSYNAVLEYKKQYEGEDDPSSSNEAEPSESATPTPDVRWFYKDPRGIVRGPWASSLMQSWFKDNFLPSDLPVRRDTEEEYITLEELQRQSVDPNSPFVPPPPGLAIPVRRGSNSRSDGLNPLLEPTSLLTQEKRFGPPALFYSSRGGHSTSIVDYRGRSVLKGRIQWTPDEHLPSYLHPFGRLGDVKRLEAFEIGDRTILAAIRQGGLEAVDLGDATMTPGDGCRTVYPYFNPPAGTYNRRLNFVWRTGTPVPTDGKSMKPSESVLNVIDSTVPTGRTAKRRSLNPALLTTGKSPTGKGGPLSDGEEEKEGINSTPDDLLVLGRFNDSLYICDRSLGRFRLLELAASPQNAK